MPAALTQANINELAALIGALRGQYADFDQKYDIIDENPLKSELVFCPLVTPGCASSSRFR
jgi:hypothetical protein